MSTSSSDADGGPQPRSPEGEEVVSRWIVRLFLVLAFGLAFGIEGMTLVRSFVLDSEEESKQRTEEERAPAGERAGGEKMDAVVVRPGDDLLPSTTLSEQVMEMKIQAQADGPWTFRFEVQVRNDGDGAYTLTVQDLETESGEMLEGVHSVPCAPGDTARLAATWSVGPNARPHSLTAIGEVRVSADSTRAVRRRVSFGHVPVQMER